MTRDDIIRMALEAGFMNVRGGRTDDDKISDYWDCWPGQLENFARLVAAAEREACAQIVDANAAACANNSMLQDVLRGNAAAIRARGETP